MMKKLILGLVAFGALLAGTAQPSQAGCVKVCVGSLCVRVCLE